MKSNQYEKGTTAVRRIRKEWQARLARGRHLIGLGLKAFVLVSASLCLEAGCLVNAASRGMPLFCQERLTEESAFTSDPRNFT